MSDKETSQEIPSGLPSDHLAESAQALTSEQSPRRLFSLGCLYVEQREGATFVASVLDILLGLFVTFSSKSITASMVNAVSDTNSNLGALGSYSTAALQGTFTTFVGSLLFAVGFLALLFVLYRVLHRTFPKIHI